MQKDLKQLAILLKVHDPTKLLNAMIIKQQLDMIPPPEASPKVAENSAPQTIQEILKVPTEENELSKVIRLKEIQELDEKLKALKAGNTGKNKQAVIKRKNFEQAAKRKGNHLILPDTAEELPSKRPRKKEPQPKKLRKTIKTEPFSDEDEEIC